MNYPNTAIPQFENICSSFAGKDIQNLRGRNAYRYNFYGRDKYKDFYVKYLALLKQSGFVFANYGYADEYTIEGNSIVVKGTNKPVCSVSIRNVNANHTIERDELCIDIVIMVH